MSWGSAVRSATIWCIVGSLFWCILGCKGPSLQNESSSANIQIGFSSTKVRSDKPPLDAAPTSTIGVPADAGAVGDAGTARDAHVDARDPDPRIGGNGSPAYRDENGQVHGPGGPVFMGHGPPCDVAHDHCLRPGVWFSVGNIVPGKLFRAVPVFEFESVWYDWRGREVSPEKLLRTQAARDAQIRAGTAVIVFSSETASRDRWVDSEHEALTSSRWLAAVTGSGRKDEKVRIKGLEDVPVETVRLIVEKKMPARRRDE